MQLGEVFGSKDNFSGLAVIADTHRNGWKECKVGSNHNDEHRVGKQPQ